MSTLSSKQETITPSLTASGMVHVLLHYCSWSPQFEGREDTEEGNRAADQNWILTPMMTTIHSERKGSSDTYYELITDEASHLARHLPPGSSGSHSNGAGGSAGQTYPTSAGMVPSSSHRNSVNYADRPIPAVRGHHHRESTRREVN